MLAARGQVSEGTIVSARPGWAKLAQLRGGTGMVRSCAFSLAELMVAVGILGVGMVIIAAAFPVAIDQTRQAIELQTSQIVFDEAVHALKTAVLSSQLET